MAVAVSVIFAVCWLTDSINYMLSIYASTATFGDVTYIVTSIMIMFNSAINPIVYGLVNERFREKIKRMTCRNYRSSTKRISPEGGPQGLTKMVSRTIHLTQET